MLLLRALLLRARVLAGAAVGSPAARHRLAAVPGGDVRGAAEEVHVDHLQIRGRDSRCGIRANRNVKARVGRHAIRRVGLIVG